MFINTFNDMLGPFHTEKLSKNCKIFLYWFTVCTGFCTQKLQTFYCIVYFVFWSAFFKYSFVRGPNNVSVKNLDILFSFFMS